MCSPLVRGDGRGALIDAARWLAGVRPRPIHEPLSSQTAPPVSNPADLEVARRMLVAAEVGQICIRMLIDDGLERATGFELWAVELPNDHVLVSRHPRFAGLEDIVPPR